MTYPKITLEELLKRVWHANGMVLYLCLETETMTGEEIRHFLRNWLQTAASFSYGNREFFASLDDEQKNQALHAAFPDGQYTIPPEPYGNA